MTEKRTSAEKAYDVMLARETLTKHVAPGAQIHCFVRSVASSGMSRAIDFYVVDPDTSDLLRITWSIARLCDFRLNKRGHLVRTGCGMCMAADTVSHLAQELFGDTGRIRPRVH